MREVVVGAWMCFNDYGLPQANWTSIFSVRTAHGMHYDLGELGHRYVANDGQESEDASALPLPRALLSDPIVDSTQTPGGYAWLVGGPPRRRPAHHPWPAAERTSHRTTLAVADHEVVPEASLPVNERLGCARLRLSAAPCHATSL